MTRWGRLLLIGWWLLTAMIVGAQTTEESVPVITATDNRGDDAELSLAQLRDRTRLNFYSATRDGRDVRVGVIDTGFGGLTTFEQRTGLTIRIPGEADKAAYADDSNTHGTDVMEVISSLAPGVSLYACRYFRDTVADEYTRFQRCIEYMVNQDVDIINHSAGVPILPLDGTNAWAQAVDTALDNNITWVNSAGNFAQGYLRGFFSDIDGDFLHEFPPLGAELIRLTDIPDYRGHVILSWQGAGGVDLDLEIIDLNSGEIVGESTKIQTIDTPEGSFFESISLDLQAQTITNPGDATSNIGIRIVNATESPIVTPVEIVLFMEYITLPGSFDQGSVVAPADNPRVLTVGALDANDDVAIYSSRGTLRNESVLPDIVAPTGIVLQSGEPFYGTSASAPVVTASLALFKEVFPGLAGESLVTYLLENATEDDGVIGRDTEYGEGRLQMPDGDTPPPEVVVCELEVYANTNKRARPGTNYRDVGTIPANARVTAIGRHNGEDGFEWFFLGNGEWVRSNTGDRIGDCVDLAYFRADGTRAPETFSEDCPGVRATDFDIGDRLQQLLTADPIRVLAEPTSGTTLYLVYPGQTVNIIDGPRCGRLGNGDPGRWWQITSDRGGTGWIAEGDANRSFWRVISD